MSVRYACVPPDFRQVSWDYRIHFTLVILSYVRPSTSHVPMQPTYTDTEHTFWEQITKNMSIFFLKRRVEPGIWNCCVSFENIVLMNLHSLSIALSSLSAQEQAVRKENLSAHCPLYYHFAAADGWISAGLRASVPGLSPQHKAQECAVCARSWHFPFSPCSLSECSLGPLSSFTALLLTS